MYKRKFSIRFKKPEGALQTKFVHLNPKSVTHFVKTMTQYGYMVYWIKEVT